MTTIAQADVAPQTENHLSTMEAPSAAAGRRLGLHVRVDAGAGNDVALGHVRRPSWRGGIHAIALIVAVPAMFALLLGSADDIPTRLSVTTYGVGICLMLAVSATYHRWVHGLRARCAWRRADHAAIFAAIAGSSTAAVVSAVPGATRQALLVAIWSTALIGAGCKFARWHGGDRAGTVLYATTIALGSIAIPWVWDRHGIAPAALLIVGGIVYLVGAAGFSKQWPTLRAAVFSYHEVWHVLTVVAAAAQFVAIWMVVS